MLESGEIERIMLEVVDRFLLPKFQELGMEATGEWRRSLEVRSSKDCGEIWGRDYTYYLAHGRAPGKMPPIAALTQWVKAKFGYGGKQAESIAWAVGKKIEREGTTWHKQGGTDLMEVINSAEVKNYVSGEIGRAIIRKIKHL